MEILKTILNFFLETFHTIWKFPHNLETFHVYQKTLLAPEGFLSLPNTLRGYICPCRLNLEFQIHIDGSAKICANQSRSLADKFRSIMLLFVELSNMTYKYMMLHEMVQPHQCNAHLINVAILD